MNLSQVKNISGIKNLELLAKQVVEGFITGMHKSPFHGFSVEFAEHRLYNQGESIKHIDWKLFGRTDKLFVKRYEEETNLRCQIILDVSSSMYFPVKEKLSIDNPNKITFSVYAAAAIIYLLKKQRDAFGLSLFSEKVEIHTPSKTSSIHQNYIYSELEKLLPQQDSTIRKTTSATTALHEIAEKLHKRSLIIVFSDILTTIKSIVFVLLCSVILQHSCHFWAANINLRASLVPCVYRKKTQVNTKHWMQLLNMTPIMTS